MGDNYPTVKAAAVQAASVFLDRERTLEKACDLIEEAGDNDADITVFPEGFIPGHPLWYHFHPKSSGVSARLATELFANAVEVPGPVTERLAEAAARAGTYVTMGVCEKVKGTTGTMYNSQLFFSPEGELLGKHQKIRPTTGERLVHYDGRSDTFGTVDTEFGPMSGLICGENSNPLAIFALAAEHTRIHCMSWPPTPTLATRHLIMAQAFAQMTKSFVISANSLLSDRHFELMEIEPDQAKRGPATEHGSVIVDPEMTAVAGPLDPYEEGILYARCDLERCVYRKVTHDFAGHYTRPDMFQVRLDRRPPELFTTIEQGDATTEPPTDGVTQDTTREDITELAGSSTEPSSPK